MSHPLRRESNPTRACARPRPPASPSSARGRGMHTHAPRSRAVESAATASIVFLRAASSASSSAPFAVTSSSSDEDDVDNKMAGTRLRKDEDDDDEDDESYSDMPPLMPSRGETAASVGAKTRARGAAQRRPSDSQLLRRRSTRSAARTARDAISSELASSGDTEPGLASSTHAAAARVAASASASTPTPALAARKPPPPSASQRKRDPESASSSRKRAATAAAAAAAGQSQAAPSHSSSAPRTAKRARTDLKPPPNAKNDADYDDDEPAKAGAAAEVSCCICMSEPERHEESTINGCEHRFCFGCIAKWSERENTCPLCKVRFTKICRAYPQRASRGGGGGKSGGQRSVNSKTVKQRDQRSDILSGPTLEGLLHSLAASAAGGPPHNMLDPFMRRLFSSGLISGGPNATRAFSLAEFMNDSDDDDDDFDDDAEAFHPFSFLMRSSTSHYRVGTFVPSFPTMAARAAASGAAASTESSRTAPLADRSSRQHSGRMPTRACPHVSSLSAAASPSSPRFLAVAAAAAATARPARSYATNSGDSRAGQDFANPLEIDDSSDDEIQVIGVNYPSSAAPEFM
jgi:Ring finger domain